MQLFEYIIAIKRLLSHSVAKVPYSK